MTRSISFAMYWIALPLGLLPAINVAQQPARVRPAVTASPVTPLRRYQTPAEKAMAAFQKIHKASSAPKAAGVRPMQSTSSTPSPNFGGYINAPAYPGTSTYTTAAGTSYPEGTSGGTVELTADFNKDGKPDIAVIEEDGTLNILFNDGKGGLQAPVSYLNPNYLTSMIFCMYAADVNGDGYPDIVAYDMALNNNATITWINRGNGTFSPAVTTPLDATYGISTTFAVADVNGDGKADLIYLPLQQTNSGGQNVYLEVQLGVGDGTFGTATAAKTQQISVPVPYVGQSYAGSIVLADLNGDGKPDIAVALDESATLTSGQFVVTTAIGNGDGTFSALGVVQPIVIPVTPSAGSSQIFFNSTAVHLADVNGDGKLDVLSDINGAIATALGSGTGTFKTAVTSNAEQIDNLASSVLVDVNGDGKPDFVAGGETLGIYFGNGDGTFNPTPTGSQWIIDPAGAQELVATDFNGDGITDVGEMGDASREISLFFGTGKTLVGAPDITPAGDTNGFYSELVASGKYTSSGYMSPLFIHAGSSADQLITDVSDGKGNFTSVISLAGGIPSDLEYVQPIQVDFNKDGLDDLVYATVTGDVFVALAKGDGTFGTPVSVGLPAAACPVFYAATGDVNGDGKVDLVIPYGGDQSCYASGSGVSGYYVVVGNGDGTFAPPAFTAAGTQLYSLTLADVNNDGALDLILDDGDFSTIAALPAPSYGPEYTVSIALGNGNGTFQSVNPILQNQVVTSVAVGDLNDDGKSDLVLCSQAVVGADLSTGGILLVTGNGDGTFNPPSEIATDNWFWGVKVADMNNDGNADIVATFYETPELPTNYYGMVTLIGYGNGNFAPPVEELEGNGATLPFVGHFVNDGAMDVMDNTGFGSGLFVGQGGTHLALSSSVSSLVFGQAITLTATLNPALSGRPAATGTISFFDGTTLLGTAGVSSGTAAYMSSMLSSGTHSIEAVYSGDANFNPNHTAASVITVAALVPAFSLTSSMATLSLVDGGQGIVTLNLAANAAFTGSVSLTCSGMPSNGSCTVNPASVTLAAGGTGVASVVVTTNGISPVLQSRNANWGSTAGVASMATLILIFFRRRKSGLFPASLAVAFLLSASYLVTGCSGSGGNKKVSPGSYTLTVTATPAYPGQGNLQTTKINVTVQ